MSKPVVVVIPHQLGRAEAKARLERGIAALKAKFADKVGAVDERWDGDRLDFSVTALGQNVSGGLDVAEDSVRVEMQLPWVLAVIAEKAKAYIQNEGTLLLEKKRPS